MKKRRREGGRREVLNPVLSGLTPARFILHSGPGKIPCTGVQKGSQSQVEGTQVEHGGGPVGWQFLCRKCFKNPLFPRVAQGNELVMNSRKQQ